MLPLLALLLDISATHQAALNSYKAHKFSEAVTEFTEALKTEDPVGAAHAESVVLLGQSLFMLGK